MKIKVFAILKDHLEESFEINSEIRSISELKYELLKLSPGINKILDTCRFAVNNNFIELNSTLDPNETVYIIPPSSGG